MPKYDAMCPFCQDVAEYTATYEMRDLGTPTCGNCHASMERYWFTSAHVTPERMWQEGTGAMRGRRVLLNDCDDPFEGDGTALCSDMSEEFVAKSKELKGQRSSNWGDRKGTIVFDGAGKS